MPEAQRKIFDEQPSSWRQLQNRVAQVFSEMGCDVETEAKVSLPRGTVELDVFVKDTSVAPPSNYICECKHWRRRVPKTVVHSFRTIVSEMGANRGILLSSQGFQSGAVEAVKFTNIDLLTWEQFEEMMFDRWAARISQKLDLLFRAPGTLMSPDNDELWKFRECTDASYQEWERICQRFQLVNIWSICMWHSHAGFRAVPSIGITDEGVLSRGKEPIVLDTYRKVVDHAPKICALACKELENFWGVKLRHP